MHAAFSFRVLLTLSQTNHGFYVSAVQVFENTGGKGEIARNKQFLLFPQCFLPLWRIFCHFHIIEDYRLQTLSGWKSLKFVVWERVIFKLDGKISGLSKLQTMCEMLLKVPIAANWKGVCVQNTSKPHSYHLKIW